MLLPIKLVTGKQPAKKQKVQKDLGLVITPEMQRNIEATNPQGIVERAKQIEAIRAEQEQVAQRTKQGQAQLAYEQTLKQAAQQPTQAKAFALKLQQLEKQISPPPVSKEVVMQKRVPKTPEGLATISILTDYGTANYIATSEETKILEFGTIDEGAALRNRLRQEAQAEFANQGFKKKRKTAEAYVSDTVNAALNPNFVDEQIANALREQLDDKIFDFAAKYSVGGKLIKTGRDALKSASDKLKNVDDVGAQVTAGLIDSLINPVSSFATATANVYDPTATTEERVGAAGNIGLYALSAIPVTEAVGASVKAFKTGADVAEGLTLAARSLLESTVPGRYISRKTTINDLVNVLERNGQMGGKTRGQLAKEFATGGKEFAKATGQAPELFYNKYLNDLAEKATPDTTTPELPAQFNLTKPQATTTNPVIDEALRTADEITNQAPTTGNSAIDEAFKVEQEIAGQATPQPITVYHGTTSEFEGAPSVGMSRTGAIHVTPNRAFAKQFTDINQGRAIGETPTVKEFSLDPSKVADLRQPNLKQDFIDFVVKKYGMKKPNPFDDEWEVINTGVFDPEGFRGNSKGISVDDLSDDIDQGAYWVAESKAAKDWAESKGYAGVKAIEGESGYGVETFAIFDPKVLGVSEELPVSSAMQAEQPPVPPTQTATTAIPDLGNVPIEVGISNKANLSAQELELISQAPQGQGRSASKVVEDVIQRNPADEELNILAGKVANGEALNAEQTAMLLVGQGRFNLKVFNAREALDNAIKSGASAKDIDGLREAWLIAQEEATNFAKQIQKGKSGWSDVGRVLQQKTNLFTGELSQIKANIIAEAELRKGRKLTDAEQENYKTMVDKLIGENKKLEEELAKLKATRNEATQEGRVRRTRTSASLDKLIAKKENTIRVNKATVTQKLNSEIPVATSTKIGQVITNMKLLNPFSRFTDIESNAIKLLDNIVNTPFNMAVDQATSRALKVEPLYSSSYLAPDRAKNLVTNAWEKMKADAKIVMAGGDVETIEKFGGNAGLGSKAAGLTDVPFKAVYHEDGKFIAADVKARESLKEELGAGNFGKKDIEARRTEILNNIEEHPDVIMNAEEYALNETFNNQNWASKINKALKGTVFKSPTAQLTYDELIGRFSKVITNVAIDVADRTGLGVARGVYNIADAIKSGKNLTVAERMAINKMITKGMVGMPLMYLGIKNWDKIEGEIRGVQQKYIDYGDLGKLGGPIAIFLHGASIGRAMNELPEDKVNDFVLASSLKLPLNTPFVSNVAEISDVLDNPAPKAIAKLLAKKASNTLIPAMIREIAMRMDTEKGFQTGMEPEREKYPKGSGAFDIVKGEFQSKIPGLRQQLPLKNQKVGRPDE